MIEYNNIYDGLFYVVKEAIGDYLAQGKNNQPIIFEYGNGGEWGTYPFVVIERSVTSNRDGVLNLNQYIDDSDSLRTERAKSIVYFLRVIGSNASDVDGVYRSASEIASILEGYLSTDSSDSLFREHVSCSSISQILSSTPSYKSTGNQILESCTLAIMVNTTLINIEENPHTIETIVLDGEVKRDLEDNNPLDIDITVTT